MEAASLDQLLAARRAELAYYSPYYFLRKLPAEQQQELFGTGLARRWDTEDEREIYCTPPQRNVCWLYHLLKWDTAYFGIPTFRLFTGLFAAPLTTAELAETIGGFCRQLASRAGGPYSAFSIVPAEDLRLLQGLTAAGWQLVETRLTYYHDQVAHFDHARYPVRAARNDEAAHIGRIAARARNPFDRFHADPWYGEARADAYLARYAENTVTTDLAAEVLVPDAPGLSVDSFLAIGDLAGDAALGLPMSRVLLTAVGPANRGWHVKLVAETLHRAQRLGHEAVLMTTQSTNHAVFRTCEKLGFKLGATSHVLTYHHR
ncbi:MAG TPA: hypothetical protein VF629_09625 [Hymenobacter sp.]|jgi:dTDP-4-amino-4,6-dideoxy-D-galactose acyltransferase|uniref:hypothetical protein n=1 Tax=Hymenobacter sp. TaxID=1898978 RepID=UPI002EDA2551